MIAIGHLSTHSFMAHGAKPMGRRGNCHPGWSRIRYHSQPNLLLPAQFPLGLPPAAFSAPPLPSPPTPVHLLGPAPTVAIDPPSASANRRPPGPCCNVTRSPPVSLRQSPPVWPLQPHSTPGRQLPMLLLRVASPLPHLSPYRRPAAERPDWQESL